MRILLAACAVFVLSFVTGSSVSALERPDMEFKVFQFPADRIPCIDGDPSDWDMVPEDYRIGNDQLVDTGNNSKRDPQDLDVTVTVGWVKGMNTIFLLYEAYDDFWNFDLPGGTNDIFELVVDGDLSGGALIPQLREDKTLDEWEGYSLFHGVHAQNYHICTPAVNKPWTLIWGCQPWIRELPWSNAAYSYDFKHGESGKLILECWITPFDYAPYDGPGRAKVSRLEENAIIGLSWAIIDYDETRKNQSFFNLSHKSTMYGNASHLCAFRLMPVERQYQPKIAADWSFKVLDMERRIVAFTDLSVGNITSWLWEFPDGTTSTEQNPIHHYTEKPGYYTSVVLTVSGPDGTAKMDKPWDVALK